MTIHVVKMMIQSREGTPANTLHLFFALQELVDDRTLTESNISENDVLMAAFEGGCLGSFTIAP